jgi:ribosomal protein L24E
VSSAINLKGQRFGSLRVLRDSGKRYGKGNGHILWLCRCKCGRKKLIVGRSLRHGITKSCGHCSHIKHGMSSHPLYPIWSGIRRRCSNPKAQQYEDYGGRGIKMSIRWQGNNGVITFSKDVGKRPKGRSLDRINNDGNYEPGNVRWATAKEQAANRRPSKYDSPLSEESEDIFSK